MVPVARENKKFPKQACVASLTPASCAHFHAMSPLRNRRPARGTPPRTWRIGLDPVDPAARLAPGATDRSAPLRVRVRFVDAATGEVAADTDVASGRPLRVNVASIDAAGAQPRRIAADLGEFLDAAVTSAPTNQPRLPR